MTTQKEQMEERWNHTVNSPFKPLDAVSQFIPQEEKILHALNFIAAQLGQINDKLGQLLKERQSGA